MTCKGGSHSLLGIDDKEWVLKVTLNNRMLLQFKYRRWRRSWYLSQPDNNTARSLSRLDTAAVVCQYTELRERAAESSTETDRRAYSLLLERAVGDRRHTQSSERERRWVRSTTSKQIGAVCFLFFFFLFISVEIFPTIIIKNLKWIPWGILDHSKWRFDSFVVSYQSIQSNLRPRF